MTAEAKKPVEPPQISNILGVLGALGEISTFFINHPGVSTVIGLISLLFIFFFGFLERRNRRPSVKALALVSTIISPIAFTSLLVIGYILFIGDPPSSVGRNIIRDSSVFLIQSDKLTDTLEGKYGPVFCCDADWAEIGFMPSHEDGGRIKEISVTGVQTPSGQAGRVFELDKTDSKTEAYFGIEKPSRAFNVGIDFSVTLAKPHPAPVVKLLVFQSYGKRDWVWRTKKWVFEYYRRPLR
jgi:hypothetical protein